MMIISRQGSNSLNPWSAMYNWCLLSFAVHTTDSYDGLVSSHSHSTVIPKVVSLHHRMTVIFMEECFQPFRSSPTSFVRSATTFVASSLLGLLSWIPSRFLPVVGIFAWAFPVLSSECRTSPFQAKFAAAKAGQQIYPEFLVLNSITYLSRVDTLVFQRFRSLLIVSASSMLSRNSRLWNAGPKFNHVRGYHCKDAAARAYALDTYQTKCHPRGDKTNTSRLWKWMARIRRHMCRNLDWDAINKHKTASSILTEDAALNGVAIAMEASVAWTFHCRCADPPSWSFLPCAGGTTMLVREAVVFLICSHRDRACY